MGSGSDSLRSITKNLKTQMHESKIHCQQPDDDSLTCYQTYRTTRAAAARVKAYARALCISVSELTRRRVEDLPPPDAPAPEVNLKLYGALAHTTENFNQMTKNCNRQVLTNQQQVVDFAVCIALLLKIGEEVEALRADLIGAGRKPP